MEKLKPIKDYPHYYISNIGKVYTDMPCRNCGTKLRELKQRKHPTGYRYVGLYYTNEKGERSRKWFRVHRLCYEAFTGKISEGLVVDHKNEIKFDNRVENLQLLTVSENLKKSYKHRQLNKLPQDKRSSIG